MSTSKKIPGQGDAYYTLEAWAQLTGYPSAEAIRHKLARANARRSKNQQYESIDIGDGWVAVKIGARPRRDAAFDPRPWRIRRADAIA